MRLPGVQLVLDTNILLHLLRGGAAGQLIDRHYGVSQRLPRAIISVVVKGELKGLAYKFGWGTENHKRVDDMLAALPAVDISHPVIIDGYARIDYVSSALGETMGKNDLWIAATTKVVGGTLLTTDGDFDHLSPLHIQVEKIPVDGLKAGII